MVYPSHTLSSSTIQLPNSSSLPSWNPWSLTIWLTETCSNPRFRASCSACVVLPTPGVPVMMMFGFLRVVVVIVIFFFSFLSLSLFFFHPPFLDSSLFFFPLSPLLCFFPFPWVFSPFFLYPFRLAVAKVSCIGCCRKLGSRSDGWPLLSCRFVPFNNNVQERNGSSQKFHGGMPEFTPQSMSHNHSATLLLCRPRFKPTTVLRQHLTGKSNIHMAIQRRRLYLTYYFHDMRMVALQQEEKKTTFVKQA